MRAWRLPALLLVPGLIVAAAVVERRGLGPERAAGTAEAVEVPMPAAAAPGAASSTFFCAGGTATGSDDGAAEHTVVVANGSGEPRRGRLTAYPSEGAVASREFDLPPHARVDLVVSELVRAPHAAALVELDGGEVAVQHELSGPTGRATGACASAPATSWYFPSGTTRPGTRMILSVFNPFPGSAVLDIVFETEDGTTRRPQQYESLVVPGASLVALDVTDVVTLREELFATVVARSGRVVVDQIQTSDGSEGSPRGLSVTLGAPAPATAWVFPDGIGALGYGERIVVANPADRIAEVDVQVLLDDPERNGVAEPFEVSIGAGSYEVVDVFADGRVPPGVAHQIVVRSRNGVAVVAQRVVTGGADAAQPGLSATIGSPGVATRWLVPVGSVEAASGAAVIVSNPSATGTATVVLRVLAGGRYEVVQGLDGVVIEAGGRRVIDLGTDALGLRPLALEVGSDRPVTVESRFGFAEGDDFSYLVAVPVLGSLGAPVDLVGTLSSETIVVGGG